MAPTLPAASSLPLALSGARVVEVHPILCGALPVTLEHQGERFQVDVFRRDPAAPGVVDLGELSFFVRNGGDGSKGTGEARELGARALALSLQSQGLTASLPAALLTFRERAARHPGAIFDAEGLKPFVA